MQRRAQPAGGGDGGGGSQGLDVQPQPLCVGVIMTFTLSRIPSQECKFLQ